MRGVWALRPLGERHSVPVEMRFIDLFMAALGSLIFMAMLLAFLLRFIPKNGGHVSTIPESPEIARPLEIVTKTLPPARIGEPYELAFAYRGGAGRIGWKVTAGEGEIPRGMALDRRRGVLSGVARQKTTARFVLQAFDSESGKYQRPFELVVLAPAGRPMRKAELALAAIMSLVVGRFWWRHRSLASFFKKFIPLLEQESRVGRRSVSFQTGPHEEETIRLPEGVAVYRQRLVSTRRQTYFLFLFLSLCVAWLVWRAWFS